MPLPPISPQAFGPLRAVHVLPVVELAAESEVVGEAARTVLTKAEVEAAKSLEGIGSRHVEVG